MLPDDRAQLGLGHFDLMSTVPGSPFAGGATATGVSLLVATSPVAWIAWRKSSSQAALVEVARIEAGDLGQVLARKEIGQVAGDLAEAVLAAGRDRHRQVALVPRVIDQQRGILDLCERIAGLAQLLVERRHAASARLSCSSGSPLWISNVSRSIGKSGPASASRPRSIAPNAYCLPGRM